MMMMQHLAHRHPFKTLFAVGWLTMALLVLFFGAPTVGT